MKQYRRLVCVRRSHLKKLAPIAMLFIMRVFMLLTFATLASASPDIIKEPSFETITYWTYSKTDPDFTEGVRSETWNTQGTYSYKFSSTGTITNTAYCQVLQSVNFDLLDTISFDAYLWSGGNTRFKASVFVGASEVRTKPCTTAATVYLHEEIDVSGYSGSQDLIFRITCIKNPTTSQDQTNYFDNIKTWGSYSNSDWTTVCNDFSISGDYVYMYGENFNTTGTYKVAYYDGGSAHDGADGLKKETDTYTDLSSGILNSACRPSDYGLSSYGTWHAVVYKTTENMPASYDLVDKADAAYAVTDSFNVQQGAIPEFPTVIAAIAVCMLCAVAYVVMRRRAGRGDG